MTDDVNGNLPQGWVWTTLGEVADLMGGGTPSREVPGYFTGSTVWLTPTEIPKDRVAVVSRSREFITQEAITRSSARIVPSGAVLMTSRASIGYVAVAGTDVTTNQGFANFVCTDAVHNFYLAYWLWSQAETYKQSATGTTFKEITKSKLKPFRIPLPSIPEQRRIVAKIEELLTRLDAGVAALKRAQANLKRYKASVLKAACEGRLVPTEAELARAEGRAYESGAELLGRILVERRAKWEADLRAKGKDPSKVKYEEPKSPETRELPALPEGWCWGSLQQLSWDSGYGTSQKCDYDAFGPIVLRIPNIVNGCIQTDDVKRATKPDELDTTESLMPGDFLIIRTNGSKDLIGRAAQIERNYDEPYYFASYLIRYRLDKNVMQTSWLGTIWNSDLLRKSIEKIASTSAGQYNVNVANLNKIVLPLPPLREQSRIVSEVGGRLSQVDKVEDAISNNLTRADRLRQSILKRAFSGKLVPQDPNDEPASVLLERIRAERTLQPALLNGMPESRRKRKRKE